MNVSECCNCERPIVREDRSPNWWHLDVNAPHRKTGVSCRAAFPSASPEWKDATRWRGKNANPCNGHIQKISLSEITLCLEYVSERCDNLGIPSPATIAEAFLLLRFGVLTPLDKL